MSPRPISAGADIGGVHPQGHGSSRSIRFYHGVLGFEVIQRWGGQLLAGGYRHHIDLNAWESGGGAPPPRGSARLFRCAIVTRSG